MIIIRLFFIISAFFLLLVCGLASLLLFRIRLNSRNSFVNIQRNQEPPKNYGKSGKIIEGEYKIIEETQKE